MRYVLLAFDEGQAPLTDVERAAHAVDEAALHAEVADRGLMVHGEVLAEADMATTVRIRNGQVEILDRPYGAMTEQLNALWIIDVPDLDVALDLARRCPIARTGSVEVRPVSSG